MSLCDSVCNVSALSDIKWHVGVWDHSVSHSAHLLSMDCVKWICASKCLQAGWSEIKTVTHFTQHAIGCKTGFDGCVIFINSR